MFMGDLVIPCSGNTIRKINILQATDKKSDHFIINIHNASMFDDGVGMNITFKFDYSDASIKSKRAFARTLKAWAESVLDEGLYPSGES